MLGHALLFMSFAALLRGSSGAEVVKRPRARKEHKYGNITVGANIALGERVASFLESIYGQERAALMLQKVAQRCGGSQPSPAAYPIPVDLDGDADPNDCASLPYGFWRRFMTEELAIQYTERKQMLLSRALKFYVLRAESGAGTLAAMRGMRARNSCRSRGGALNARKAAGLGVALLQFFVDDVQRLMPRADSIMLMKKRVRCAHHCCMRSGVTTPYLSWRVTLGTSGSNDGATCMASPKGLLG